MPRWDIGRPAVHRLTDHRQYIKNQLISVLLAGKVRCGPQIVSLIALTWWQDPVGITISWALYELARNPDVVKLLRKEIEDVYATRNIMCLARYLTSTLQVWL
jgi:hypothetical protein